MREKTEDKARENGRQSKEGQTFGGGGIRRDLDEGGKRKGGIEKEGGFEKKADRQIDIYDIPALSSCAELTR